tara:strand:- start:5661 stop:5978 length:318 start_codon:yes stop_codon:yes gene_type:complete
MHYILNTTVKLPTSHQPQVAGPTIPSMQRNRAPKIIEKRSLRPGVLYTLSYIKKEENGVNYTFKGSDGSVIVESFRSCNEADLFIAGLKGESIPEYEKFYKNLKT